MAGFITDISGATYRHIIRQIFFKADPEIVHQRITRLGEKISRNQFLQKIIRIIYGKRDLSLKKTVAGIKFPSPIGLAAGFDYQAKLPWALDALGFGFASVGTITNLPCPGNPRPWLKRLIKSESLLVNKGFKNDGIRKTLTRLGNLPPTMPVGLSIGQTNVGRINSIPIAIDDIASAFIYAEKHPHQCSYYELNISCPNVQKHISFYESKNLRQLLRRLSDLNIGRPVFIKCPISVPDDQLIAIADTAKNFSLIAGLIIGNLQRDRNHPELDKTELSDCGPGNFSGRPTRDRSTQLIKIIKKKFKTRFAIIGCGGVFGTEDAKAKFAAGADLIQLITGLIYRGPQLVSQINNDLAAEKKQN